MVADTLAKNAQGFAPNSSQWWDAPPSFVSHLLSRDSLGLPFNAFYCLIKKK